MNLFKDYSIKRLHDGLCNKVFSALELTEYFLKRIEEVDPYIRAYITVTSDLAREQAKAVDQKIAKAEKLRPLEGIPMALKDVLATKGILTTAASRILKNYRSVYHAACYEKLLEQGTVLLGKTNCDAFAHGATTENSDLFDTHNPWDLERVPGGSSGGSAASVASGTSVYALGTDTGGSIRCPAHFCGVVGLKPSYGRVSRYGLFSMTSSTDCVGSLTKSVEDAAFVLEAISGKDPRDATSQDRAVPHYADLLKKGSVKEKVVGLPCEYFGEGLDPRIREWIDKAIGVLESEGVKFKEIRLPNMKYAVSVYYILTPSEISSNLARYDGIKYGYCALEDSSLEQGPASLFEVFSKSRRYGFGDEAKRRILMGTYALSAGYFDAFYKKAMQVRNVIANDYREAFKEVDLILAPVVPHPAFKLGEKVNDPLALYLEDIYLAAASLAGLPALSLPCGWVLPEDSEKELPVGMQLVGPYFDELNLLQLGFAFEQKTPHIKKRIPW